MNPASIDVRGSKPLTVQLLLNLQGRFRGVRFQTTPQLAKTVKKCSALADATPFGGRICGAPNQDTMSIMTPAVQWYLDETKSGQFVFVIAELYASNVGRCRIQMTRIPRKHKSALHFNRESSETRTGALTILAKMPIRIILVTTPKNTKGLDARESAVRCVARLAVERSPQRVVFERDDSTVTHDRRWLSSELARRPDIEYQHLARTADPLLWIPDAVGWAYQRGGQPWNLVKHLVVETVQA